jgi:hypothetical protein
MTTAPPEPVYPMMVTLPLYVVKMNWACTTAGNNRNNPMMIFFFIKINCHFPFDFMPTTGVGLLHDFLPAPQGYKPFFNRFSNPTPVKVKGVRA